jgi:hypothetical protein
MRSILLIIPLLSWTQASDPSAQRYQIEIDGSISGAQRGRIQLDTLSVRAVVSVAVRDSGSVMVVQFRIDSAWAREWTLGEPTPVPRMDPSAGSVRHYVVEPGKPPRPNWLPRSFPSTPALTYLSRIPADLFPPIAPEAKVGDRWADTVVSPTGSRRREWVVGADANGVRTVEGREVLSMQAVEPSRNAIITVVGEGTIAVEVSGRGPVQTARIHRTTNELITEPRDTLHVITSLVTHITRLP